MEKTIKKILLHLKNKGVAESRLDELKNTIEYVTTFDFRVLDHNSWVVRSENTNNKINVIGVESKLDDNISVKYNV